MHLALEELERQGVCTRRADGVMEIRDRFWPYQREYDSAARDESRRYVEEVKRRFLQRRCVQSSFTAADEKRALTLHHRGVSLLHVERAILLGARRKYAAVRRNGRGTPISSLHYFANVSRRPTGDTPQYWTRGEYIRANRALGYPRPDYGKVKCAPKKDKTRDAVGQPSPRSSLSGNPGAIFFREKPGQAQRRRKRASTKKWFHKCNLRDETIKRKRNNDAEYDSCTLINLDGIGHDCNPRVAALRLYSHARNEHSHRAGIDHSHRRNTHWTPNQTR